MRAADAQRSTAIESYAIGFHHPDNDWRRVLQRERGIWPTGKAKRSLLGTSLHAAVE